MRPVRCAWLPTAFTVCAVFGFSSIASADPAETPVQTPPSPVEPLSALVGPGDYPETARRAGVQGWVDFRLRVDENGRPYGCVVMQSSGSPDLDNRTCDVMMARARFHPGLGPDRLPVRSDFSQRVRWQMPGGAAPWQSALSAVRVTITPDGTISDCTATGPAMSSLACARFGNTALISLLLGKSTTAFQWVEMRQTAIASGTPPPDTRTPEGTVTKTAARAVLSVNPDGQIVGCQSDTSISLNGNAMNLCASVPDKARYVADTSGRPRKMTAIVEMVAQPR